MVRPFPHTTAVSGQHAPLAPQLEAAAHGEPGFVGFNSASHQRQQNKLLTPTRSLASTPWLHAQFGVWSTHWNSGGANRGPQRAPWYTNIRFVPARRCHC